MKLKKPHLGFVCLLILLLYVVSVYSQTSAATDAAVMQELKKGINPPSSLSWSDPDPCKWDKVQCAVLMAASKNALTGSLPSFAGLSSLQSILLSDNGFTSIPNDFFDGMTSLQSVYLDKNPFSPCLTDLHLSFNNLEGPLPSSFSGSSIQSLWLNGLQGRLNGSIALVQNMTQLTQLWLQGNEFSGPWPDRLSGLTQLHDCNLRDNSLTGPVPNSLVNLPSLKMVNLTNNLLQVAYAKCIFCASG
ncbi:hypothetical protein HAX54_019130 [Datura stramonium]|uniref:Leucine-rich repeat-containing N-terminal plant-type domain-containing protein n=1 Tax=Datura stramonium TaxID=4076 RepID=A0ABS8UQJ6_DATST|nr:hypothetical protein [Datura stramonium]